jgi:hypothetical protein
VGGRGDTVGSVTVDLIDYVRAQRTGVVSTLGPGGQPQAAYLTFAVTGRGELVFDAKPDSMSTVDFAGRGGVRES